MLRLELRRWKWREKDALERSVGAGSAGYEEPEERVNIFLGFHHRKWKTNSRGIPGKKMTKLGMGVEILQKSN